MNRAKESYYKMTRQGMFVPQWATLNQCVQPEQPAYHYVVQMVFPGSVKLNDKRFIVDHHDVHQAVTQARPSGSCEDMERIIMSALNALMDSRKVRMLACKCTLRGSEVSNPAFLEFTECAAPKYLRLLQ